MKHQLKKRAQQGFTLIELMIVVAVAGIILLIALPSFNAQMLRSRRSVAKTDLGQCALQRLLRPLPQHMFCRRALQRAKSGTAIRRGEGVHKSDHTACRCRPRALCCP